MITRRTGYLTIATEPVPPAADQLQRDGFVMLRGVFDDDEVAELIADIERVYAEWPPDERSDRYEASHWEPFRYEMLNRSAVVQRAIANPIILEVIEPLLGEDCHVIANTAWRQQPDDNEHGGHYWHIDSGPHVPRPADVPWDDRIPYPVFAVATHLYLWDCPIESGPTGVLRGSHTSGQHPPLDRMEDDDLEWNGEQAVPLVASAGDVALFASDVWHRRLPSLPGDPGRFFLQCHYGRRDLAQRLRPTSVSNQLSPEAIERAKARRERTLVGLHRPFFYDG
ncbi:MAG TPA: phytanoyl-CoA dioxygenase family protein [Acidimicrobiales bacterium]|nr:phytanoyl-CoA dioxygenase family protein [Acidimicrobiales bacterium]